MSAPGYRNDQGKPLYHLLPTDALAGVTDVLTFGAKKYAERNWEKGMSWSRCFNSMMRHAWAFWRGEDLDPESGLPHTDHLACNALFLAAYFRRPQVARFDDREHHAHAKLYAPAILDQLKDCTSCGGTNGYHRTPCAHFEVAAR
jgi:hypothetical protein